MEYVNASAKKFALYLSDINGQHSEDFPILKEDARTIFYDDQGFKKTFEIKASFASVLFASQKLHLCAVRGPRKEPIILYNIKKISKLKNEALQIDSVVENGKNLKKRTLITQNIAFRSEKNTKLLISPKECKLCKVKFSNKEQFSAHVQKADHLFHADFIEAIQSSTNLPRTNILNFNVHGFSLRYIILRKNVRTPFKLGIRNDRKVDCEIREIKISPKLSQVDFSFAGPIIVKKKSNIVIDFNVIHNEYGILYFPVLFVLQLADERLLVPIEMVFHIQSENLDDLQPIAPYKKTSRPVIQEFVQEIDRGEAPEVVASNYKRKVELKSYSLTADFFMLLNTGLKKFDAISPSQLKLLDFLKELLDVEDKKNCLCVANYSKMLDNLLFFEEHQMKKDIRDYDCKDQILEQKPGSRLLKLEVPGLAEHRPSLVRGDSVYVRENPNSTILYQGIVHKVELSSVFLGFSPRFLTTIYAKMGRNQKFFVSFGYNRHTLKVEHQAVEYVAKHDIASFFFPESIPTSLEMNITEKLQYRNPDIAENFQQQQAIRAVLDRTSYPYPYLIFGPPGTGKTVTVTECVEQVLFRNPKHKVLICTPSNSAGNVLTTRLAKRLPTTDLFRFVAASFPFHQIPEDVRKFVNYVRDDFYLPSIDQLKKYRVVITTLVNASRFLNGALNTDHFQYVFIDESGHATESETLIPLAGIVTSLHKIEAQIVLAGDPQQLGPIIHSTLATDYGFGISMLERLMTTSPTYKKGPGNKYNPNALTKLVKNYRSHPLLIKVPNELYYDNELEACGNPDIINLAVGWEELPNPQVPIIFHSVLGMDMREATSPSFFNIQEVEVVLKYLDLLIGTKLKGRKIESTDIAVISPYKKQVDKVNRACNKKNYKVDVGSVEFFQGQERLIVIISTVRSKPEFLAFDHKYHLGFLKNPKRLNVALTRAKALLIIIGNPNVLQCDKDWKSLIQFCQENNAIKGQAFTLLEDDDVDEVLEGFETLTVEDVEETPKDGPNFSRGNM